MTPYMRKLPNLRYNNNYNYRILKRTKFVQQLVFIIAAVTEFGVVVFHYCFSDLLYAVSDIIKLGHVNGGLGHILHSWRSEGMKNERSTQPSLQTRI